MIYQMLFKVKSSAFFNDSTLEEFPRSTNSRFLK